MGERVFSSGAVRDSETGKGRFDLIDITAFRMVNGVFYDLSALIECLETKDYKAAAGLCESIISNIVNNNTMTYTILSAAIIAEKGAAHYGAENWKKGMPYTALISSFIRHYGKFSDGNDDEPHKGAAVWNMQALHWMCLHHHDMNDFSDDGINARVIAADFSGLDYPEEKNE